MTTHLIAMSALIGLGLLLPQAALAQDKQQRADQYSTYKKLEEEQPPEFVPSEPWIKPNIRVGGGLGAFSLSNDGAAAATLGGFGLSAWAHLGDKFFDFIGYYVSLRGSIFGFDAIEANGQRFDNFNSKSAISFDGGLGLDVWVVPKWVSLSVEGAYQVLAVEALPVKRDDYTISQEMTGIVGRARVALFAGPLGLHGEYSHWLPMSDPNNSSSWGGYQATINLSYAYGGK